MKTDIGNISILYGVEKNILNTLIQKNKIYEREYSRDSTIHNQGDKCETLDIVCSGSLVAYSISINGSENIIFDFKAGSVIGANLLFGENNRYPMNIYCTANCVLMHISKAAVYELLKNYNFVLKYINSISLNSQGMNQKIAMYTQKNLRENLLDYFSALSAKQKSKTILLPVTKKQLADYFGVQRPSLFRELKRMKDDGIIDIKNKIIKLKT